MGYSQCMQEDRFIMLKTLRQYTGVYSNYLRLDQICRILTALAESGVMTLKNQQTYGERIVDIVEDTRQNDADKIKQLEQLLADMTRRKNELEALRQHPETDSIKGPLDELKEQISRLQDMIPAHKDIKDEVKTAVMAALNNYRRETIDPLMNKFIERNEEITSKLKSFSDALAMTSNDDSRTEHLVSELNKIARTLQQQPGAFQTELQKFISSLREFESYLNRLRSESPKVSEELEALRQENNNLRQKMEGLKDATSYSELESKVMELQDAVQRHQDAENELKRKLTEEEEEIDRLRREIDQGKEAIGTECEEKLREYQKEIVDSKTEIENLKMRLNEAENAEAINNRIQELEDELTDCRSKMESLKDQIEDRKQSIKQSVQVQRSVQTSADVDTLNRIRELEEELDAKKNQIAAAENALRDNNQSVRIQQLEEEISDLKEKLENNSYESRVQELESDLKRREEQINDMELKIERLESKEALSASEELKLQELQDKYEQKIQELEEKEAQLKTLNDKVQQMDTRYEELYESYNQKIAELDELKANTNLATELEELKKEYNAKLQELEEADRKLSESDMKVKDTNERIEQLEKELEYANSRDYDLLARELAELKETIPTYNLRIQELEDSIAEKEKKLSNLQEEYDSKTMELQELSDKISNGHIEEDKLKEQIKELQDKIAECLDKQESIIKDYEDRIAVINVNNEDITSTKEKLEAQFKEEKEAIMAKYQDEIDNYKKALEEKEKFILSLQKEVDEKGDITKESLLLQERVDSLERKIQALEKALEECNSENTEKSRSLEQKDKEISELNEHIKDSESVIASNKEAIRQNEQRIQELDRLVMENESLKSTIDNLNSEINGLRNTNEDVNNYKTLLNEAKARIDSLQRDYDNEKKLREEEIDDLKNRNGELEIRASQAEQQLAALKSEVESIINAKDSTIQELRDIISEKDTLLGAKEQECLDRIRREIEKIRESHSREQSILPPIAIDECKRIKKELPQIASQIEDASKLIKYHIGGIKTKTSKPIKNKYISDLVKKRMPMIDETSGSINQFEQDKQDMLSTEDCTKITRYGERYEGLLNSFGVRGPEIADLYELLSGIGKTFIRIKPRDSSRESTTKIVEKISDTELKYLFRGKKDTTPPPFGPFDKIFTENVPTREIFKEIVPALDNLNGEETYNIVLLSYGQSGSGKTFTLLGERNESTGILTKGLFSYVCEYLKVSDFVKEINVRMFQLYRGAFYDIYTSMPSKVLTGEESFNMDNKTNSIDRMSSRRLDSFEGTSVLDYFTVRRFQRKTPLNKNSSRSHAFIELVVSMRNGNTSIIAFCDLGGSEDLKIYSEGALARPEGEYIVKSLMDLGDILTSYAAGKEKFKGGGIYSGNALRNVLNRYLDLDRERSEDVLNRFYLFISVRGYLPQKDDVQIEIAKNTNLNTLLFSNKLRSQNV